MDLTWNEEELLLQRSCRELLEAICPPTIARRFAYGEVTATEQLWKEVSANGWLGAGVAEELGGIGGSLIAAGIFFFEAGRVLLPTSVRTTVLVGRAIEVLGSGQQRRDYLRALAAGGIRAGLPLVPPADPAAGSGVPPIRIEPRQNRFVATGTQLMVANARDADLILLFAECRPHGERESFIPILVKPDAKGVNVRPHAAFGGEPLSAVELHEADLPADQVLGLSLTSQARADALDVYFDQTLALHCMEMAGGSEKVNEITASYLLQREQFGRPLGSFQAVRQHLANMTIQSDGQYVTACQALWRVANGKPASREATIAKLWAAEACKFVTLTAHQLHGGIGYIRENDLHLWSERAAADSLSLGSRAYHLRRLARIVRSGGDAASALPAAREVPASIVADTGSGSS